jgi:uncharacterized protein
LVARDERRLQIAARALPAMPGGVAWVAADLARADDRDHVVASVEGTGRAVDVLVNSAGFGIYRPFVGGDRSQELRQVRLLVEAVADLEARWLPGMVGRGAGAVVNVASVAAFQPLPGNGTYAAAKAWVLAHTEALAEELRGSGVSVTAVCPGPVPTAFHDRCAPLMTSRFPRAFWCNASAVSETALEALARGRPSVVPGGWVARSCAINRCLPRAVLRPAVRWLAAGELARGYETDA